MNAKMVANDWEMILELCDVLNERVSLLGKVDGLRYQRYVHKTLK